MFKQNTEWEILTPEGFKDFDGINYKEHDEWVDFTFDNNKTLGTSQNHKIDTSTGYKYAYELKEDDDVLDENGNQINIISKNVIDEKIKLYDLINVDDERHRFIANGITVSNCAHVPTTLWDEFWESVYPTISSSKTSKIILVSTPKGMNHFYKLWTLAERDENDFVPIEINWWDVPGYDEKWKKQTIGNIGKRKFSQEFDCNFLASSNSLIDGHFIEAMPHKSPIPLHETNIYMQIMEINQNFEDLINIYELPKPDHKYAIGVDPAKITEESAGDSLAIQVLDVTDTEKYENIATVLIKNEMHYLEIPDFLSVFGMYYNEAHFFIENNDSVGQEIVDTLVIDYEYDNVYSEPTRANKANVLGFRTTVKNKKIGCLNLKMLVEKNQLIINDFDTINQLSTFIKKANSYKAEEGYSDDAVMSLIASLVFMQDRMYFEDRMKLMTEITSNRIPSRVKEVVIEEMPFGMDSNFDETQLNSEFAGNGWSLSQDIEY